MPYERSKEEEKYFQVREKDRRAQLRRELEAVAREARERKAMRENLGTSDDELIERLRKLHFDADTARVLDLLPLVHVAWADDDSVDTEERAAILDILGERGIRQDEEAFILIETLLEQRPSAAFLNETLDLLRAIIGEDADKAKSVVDLSVKVAEASRGLFGLGRRVKDEEYEVIQRISDGLGEAAQERFRNSIRRRR